jgi:tripartite-type tricarboxylate transporter receptor subunit TctC
MIRALASAVAMLLGIGINAVYAQSYPSKPMRLIAGASAGSASDLIARSIQDRLAQALGQPVIVENRLGAGGLIASGLVAKSEPDGHTISVYTSALTVVPFTATSMPYDPAKDLVPVATLATIPNVLIAAPGRFKSVQELVAAAKAKPGNMTYASAGAGTSTHMSAEKFRFAAGFEGIHVPYKGSPEAITDVMTGRVDFFFAPLVSAVAQIRDGKVQALAVGLAKRTPALPNVPSTVESGYPNSDYNFWVGMLVAGKTPQDIVNRLNTEVNKILAAPEVRERIAKLGADPLPMSPQEFAAMVKHELDDNAKLVKAAGIKGN